MHYELCRFSIISMIKLVQSGNYKLIETKGQTKILMVDDFTFAWVNAEEIGEILVVSHTSHVVDHFLSIGKYRLYKVKDEPNLTDTEHLELFIGDGMWQGYLLPTGLPTEKKKRNRIIPTRECITKTTTITH